MEIAPQFELKTIDVREPVNAGRWAARAVIGLQLRGGAPHASTGTTPRLMCC